MINATGIKDVLESAEALANDAKLYILGASLRRIIKGVTEEKFALSREEVQERLKECLLFTAIADSAGTDLAKHATPQIYCYITFVQEQL